MAEHSYINPLDDYEVISIEVIPEADIVILKSEISAKHGESDKVSIQLTKEQWIYLNRLVRQDYEYAGRGPFEKV